MRTLAHFIIVKAHFIIVKTTRSLYGEDQAYHINFFILLIIFEDNGLDVRYM